MIYTFLLLTLTAHTTSATFTSNQIDEGSVFDVILSQLKGRGSQIAEFAQEFVLDDAILENIYEIADILDDEGEENTMNRSSCVLCRAVITAGKSLVAANEWEELRDPLVEVCHFLFENLTDLNNVNTEVLCPGAIDLQGPHVYEILRPIHRKSPEEICRNLNACFPPPDDFEPIGIHARSTKVNEKPAKSLEQRKAEALKVVQMTDIHIEPLYVEETLTECGLYVCCIERYGEGPAGYYGDYNCNIPPRTMELFFQRAAEMDPAFVLISGDTPPHKFWDETYHSQLNCTEILIDSATKYFGNTRVFPNIGNHDMFPTNLLSMEYLQPYTQNMTNAFADGWANLAGFGPDQDETMRNGGYYSIEALPGLRVISLNTNYWYTYNWYNTLNMGEPEVENMISFLRETMDLARQNNEKLIFIGHHPVGKSDCIIEHSRDFARLVANYSDLIVLHVAGHTHSDQYIVLSDIDGNALAMTFVNPTAGTKSNSNPSMRVYYLDATTYDVIDYEQYGFDLLEASGSTEPPSIDLLYSAILEYEIPDMSPSSWQNLTARMMEDDDLFNKYYNNYRTRYNGTLDCNDACKNEHLCSNSVYNFDEYIYCIEDWEMANNITTVAF